MARPARPKRPDTPDEWWGRPEEMDRATSVLLVQDSAWVAINHLRQGARGFAEPVLRDYIKRCEKRLTELEGR